MEKKVKEKCLSKEKYIGGLLKLMIVGLLALNLTIFSQAARQTGDIYSEQLNRIFVLRKANISGLNLEGEKLNRVQHRNYYHQKFLALGESFQNVVGLKQAEKVFLTSFAQTLAINVIKGFPKEKGVDLNSLKSQVLPILKNLEEKMENLIEQNQNPPSRHLSLLAAIKIEQSPFIDFISAIGKFSDAKKLLEAAIEKNSQNYPAIIGLALSYYFPPNLFGGSFKQTANLLEKVLSATNSPEEFKYSASIWTSQNWMKKKDYEKAREWLSKAREIFPQGDLALFADQLFKNKKRIGE